VEGEFGVYFGRDEIVIKREEMLQNFIGDEILVSLFVRVHRGSNYETIS